MSVPPIRLPSKKLGVDDKMTKSPLHIDCGPSTSAQQTAPTSSFVKDITDLIENGRVTTSLSDSDRHNIRLIETHPIYPLIKILMMQCDKATWNLTQANTTVDADKLLKDFKFDHGSCKLALNPELDNLMLYAVSVLRIHLFELSKVSELCIDFKQRYLGILKARVSQESLLGITGDSDDDNDTSIGDNGLVASMDTRNGVVNVPLSGNDVTPLSSMVFTGDSTTPTSTPTNQNVDWGNFLTMEDVCLDDTGCATGKRTQLPSHSVDLLKQWLFKNVLNPYPSESEKVRLSAETGLTVLQLNNWFINARRRILQPLLDLNAISVPTTGKQPNPTPPASKKQKIE